MRKLAIFTAAILLAWAAAEPAAFGKAAPKGHASAQDQAYSVQVRDLLDRKVQNRQGDNIGRVEDLVMDDQGRVRFLILSSDLKGGGAPKKFAIPFNALGTAGKDRLVLDVSRDRLAGAPEFKDGTDLFAGSTAQHLYQYYGFSPHSGVRAAGKSAAPGKDQPAGEKSNKPSAVENRNSFLTGRSEEATDLIGKVVKDSSGEDLGIITEVVPGREGEPGLAVLAGANYELWEKKIAVPLQSLSAKSGAEELSVPFSTAQLIRAPEFKEGPGTADEANMAEIYRFYGIQPSWDASLDEINPGKVDQYRYDYYWLWQ